jgi:hypothetical protein
MRYPYYLAGIIIRDCQLGRIKREFSMLCLNFRMQILRESFNYKSGFYKRLSESKIHNIVISFLYTIHARRKFYINTVVLHE